MIGGERTRRTEIRTIVEGGARCAAVLRLPDLFGHGLVRDVMLPDRGYIAVSVDRGDN